MMFCEWFWWSSKADCGEFPQFLTGAWNSIFSLKSKKCGPRWPLPFPINQPWNHETWSSSHVSPPSRSISSRQAEGLHRRALEGSESQLGPQHPDTLKSVNSLANLFYKQGKLEEAGMRSLGGRHVARRRNWWIFLFPRLEEFWESECESVISIDKSVRAGETRCGLSLHWDWLSPGLLRVNLVSWPRKTRAKQAERARVANSWNCFSGIQASAVDTRLGLVR